MAARLIWVSNWHDDPLHWSLSPCARELRLAMWGNGADDCGLLPLSYPYLRRHCLNPYKLPSAKKTDRLIDELLAADFLRAYQIGEGKLAARFGFIPKFSQRMRQTVIRWPIPPREIYEDDEHAKELFQKISVLSKNLSADRQQSAAIPPPKRSEGSEVEKKRSDGEASPPINRAAAVAVLLRDLEKARGKAPKITSADPRVVAWADAGVTDEQLREAHALAVADREAKGDPMPINAGFLDVFVNKIRHPGTAPARAITAAAIDWYRSDAGWQSKARELGIVEADFLRLQARVCVALGAGPWVDSRNATLQRLINEIQEAA